MIPKAVGETQAKSIQREARAYSQLQLLLKLGGLDDIDCIASPSSSPLVDALQSAIVADAGDSLSPISSCLMTVCTLFFRNGLASIADSPSSAAALFSADGGACSIGGQHEMDIQISKTSSANKHAANMLTAEPSSYWQSSGSLPHWFEITIPESFIWTEILLLTHDFESYSPQTINVKMDATMIKEKIKLETKSEWVTLATLADFKAAGSPSGNVIRLEVTKNHQGGCDCKVAGVRVLGGPQIPIRHEEPQKSMDVNIGNTAKPLTAQAGLLPNATSNDMFA